MEPAYSTISKNLQKGAFRSIGVKKLLKTSEIAGAKVTISEGKIEVNATKDGKSIHAEVDIKSLQKKPSALSRFKYWKASSKAKLAYKNRIDLLVGKFSPKIAAPNTELEEFKKNLKTVQYSSLGVYKVDPFESLFPKMMTANLKPQEMIDCLFDMYPGKNILKGIDMILHQNPTFSLSPFDQVRKEIIKDCIASEPALNREALDALIKGKGIDREKGELLHQFAHKSKTPYIEGVV